MSLILIISITIRLVAMGWSIALMRRMRDWRMGLLTVVLALMAMRQTFTLLAEKESWAISITGHITELPGLAVSIIAFLAVFFLERVISKRRRAEKRIEKDQLIAIPWRIYFLIGTVGLIVVTMIGLSFHTGIRMNATYAPLIHASMEIKQEAALAHLWFEEIITGDKQEDIRVVWEHLDQADWYAQAMLEGGISPKGTFIPLDDAEMRQITKDVQKNLIEFREITHRRLITKETAGIGTEIDQRYDAIFKTFINQADKVETRLQQIMARDLHGFQLLQVILIIASIILTLIVGIVFHLYNRHQAEDFLTIDKVNKNLEKEVVERKQAEEQILRQSAVLKAINKVFQKALVCETDEEVAQTCLAVAEELSGSKFGFIGEVNQSGRFDTIALSDPVWKACRVPRSDATSMIKNMEIRGIWGNVLRDKKPLIVNDPASYHDRFGTPAGHLQLTSFLGIPLKHGGRTIGMFALANKESGFDYADQQDVEALSVAFVEALMRKRAEQALKESEEKYRTLSEVAQDAIFVINRDDTITFVNTFAAKQFGLTSKDLIGKRRSVFFPKDVSESQYQKLRKVFDSGEPLSTVDRVVYGKIERWLSTRLVPLKSDTGEINAILGLSRDITELKQAEDRIQHLQNVLMEIRNINQLIVHEKNQQKLLQESCEILIQTQNYELVWIGLIEEGTKNVLPVAQAGFEDGYLKSVKTTWDDSETGRGPTGTAIRTGKPFVMRDIAGDSRYKPWREEALKHGYASSVAVPLIHEDRVWGALNVYATIPNSFNKEETKLLLEVGQDIAFALHIIKLEEERKQAEEELQKHRDENTRLDQYI